MKVGTAARGGPRERAAASVVGLVLLFGIVIAGAGVVFVTGMEAKDSMQTASELDAAETWIEGVGTEFDTLSHKRTDATTTLDLSGRDPNDVSVTSDGTINFRLNENPACTAERDLGSVVYEHDSGVAFAYQAGGVFRQSSAATSVVTSPTLEYRTESVDGRPVRTVLFPVVNVSGSVDSTGTVVAESAPRASGGLQEDLCLTGANSDEMEYARQITITVEDSEYYEAWLRYFESEFGTVGEYSVDHDAQRASVTAPLGDGVQPSQFTLGDERIYGAIFSTTPAGGFLLQTRHAGVDSYDSTLVPADGSQPTYRQNGSILTRGRVEVLAADARIAGNVYGEGVVELSTSCGQHGNYCVEGDVYVNNSTATGTDTSLYPENENQRSDLISGDWDNGTVVPDVSPMDDKIVATVDVARTFNDNDDVPVVDGNEINYTGGSATLESGVYYLENATVPAGNTLELDTSGGDIVLAVDGDAEFKSDATVTVTGDGQVRAFLNESTSDDYQVRVRPGVTVETVEGGTRTYRPNALFIDCKSGCGAAFDDTTPSSRTKFTGIIYGPSDDADAGNVSVGKHVDIWGALVAGTVTFEQQTNLHFDEQLIDDDATDTGDANLASDIEDGSTYSDDSLKNGYVVSVSTHDVNVSTGNEAPRLSPALARSAPSLSSTTGIDRNRPVRRAPRTLSEAPR